MFCFYNFSLPIKLKVIELKHFLNEVEFFSFPLSMNIWLLWFDISVFVCYSYPIDELYFTLFFPCNFPLSSSSSSSSSPQCNIISHFNWLCCIPKANVDQTITTGKYKKSFVFFSFCLNSNSSSSTISLSQYPPPLS